MADDRLRPGAPGAADPLREAREQLEQAEQLRLARKFDRAETLCNALVRRYPDYFAALHTLGLICADKGDHLRAMGFLARAAMLNPRNWMTLTALSGVYLELGAKEMAARTLEQARALNAGDPTILVTLGEIYREEREYDLARDAYRDALTLEPAMAEASIGLADASEALGDYAEAARVLEALVARAGPSLAALQSLANLPPSVITIDMLAALDRVVPPPGMGKAEFETASAFIRAAALDKARRTSEAWEQLASANRLAFGPLQKALADDQASQRKSLAWVRDNPAIKPVAGAGPVSLFIMGPSRSGKSIVEALVAQLDGVRRGYENPGVENAISRTFQAAGLLTNWSLERLPPQFFPQCRDIYREELARRAGSAKVFTNTHPGYIHEAGRLAATLPNVRFLFVKRNVEDNALRILMRKYHRGNAYAYDVKATLEHIGWYHQMMDTLAAKLVNVSRTVMYEDLIEDPLRVLADAATLCGLPMPAIERPAIGDDRGCGAPYRQYLEEFGPLRVE